MNRVVLLALLILGVGLGVAFFYGGFAARGPAFAVASTLYDTNADGTADLTVERIGDIARIWHWDRDGDGVDDVIAYDSAVNETGALAVTGDVTAWDFGADQLLDEGDVPQALRQILASEELQSARAAAGPGIVDLVDMQTRGFVTVLGERYDSWRLSGFRMPIVGASLPAADRLLPGARRDYRFGVHQGFDMYEGQIGVPTGYGGPVVAARSGRVARADVDYVELTPEQYAEAIATSRAAGTTPPRELDLLRGRQVWIDHGQGIITRYAHLSSIAPEIVVGKEVAAGDIVGFVGNSGMEDATTGSRAGAHLHFELRIDDRYLGQDMTPEQVREVAGRILGVAS